MKLWRVALVGTWVVVPIALVVGVGLHQYDLALWMLLAALVVLIVSFARLPYCIRSTRAERAAAPLPR